MSTKKKQISIIKIVYFLMTALAVGGLFYNRILPDMISNIIKVILVLMLLVFSIIHTKKLLLIILSVLLFLTSGVLFYSQYSINRLISQENTETDVITLVVLKDSPLTKIEDLKDAKIGFTQQMDSGLVAFVRKTITEKAGAYTIETSSDDLGNVGKLMDKTVDVMVLDNSLRDTLVEQMPEFEAQTKIIATLKKTTIKDDTAVNVDTSKKPFIVLISGVDTRTSGAVAEKARSDVNILMIIDPKSHQVQTISIPRDTYTPLGCRTGAMDKLTHSGVYGIDCTVKTVENLFDIKVNYYVKVNFTAFLNVVKVLGKIDVYSKYAFTTTKYVSYYKHYTFKQGMNTMNAEQALFFARERHAFVESDVQRGLNQQEVIKGIVNKITEPATLLKIEDLISVASKSVVTNMPIESVMKLVQNQIADNTSWTITTAALTGRGDYQGTYSMGMGRPLYVSWPDQNVLADLKVRIAEMMNPELVS